MVFPVNRIQIFNYNKRGIVKVCHSVVFPQDLRYSENARMKPIAL